MKEQFGRAKPRVRPQMNTDTKRHAEKPAYHRKSKYKEDLLDDEDLDVTDVEEEGVLSDFEDEEPDDDATPPPVRPSGRRR